MALSPCISQTPGAEYLLRGADVPVSSQQVSVHPDVAFLVSVEGLK